MTGLIWMVQIVHYPLFDTIGAAQFGQYHAAHTRLITYIVMPVMLLELATAFYLSYEMPAILQTASFLWWLAVGALVLIWLSTFLLQIPAHNALTNGFEQSAYEKLVSTNWVRTVLWTFRSVLLFYFLK